MSQPSLGCVSALFQCFKSHHKNENNGDQNPVAKNNNGVNGNINGINVNDNGSNCLVNNGTNGSSLTTNSTRRRTNNKKQLKQSRQSKLRKKKQHTTAQCRDSHDIASVRSDTPSEYYETYEGTDSEWVYGTHTLPQQLQSHTVHPPNSPNAMTTLSLESYESLKIDGMYFFPAKDDENTLDDYYEGIHLYPPVPTTAPPTLKHSISMSNMDSLLHVPSDKTTEEQELELVEMVGRAMEGQAQRLMNSEDKTVGGLRDSTAAMLEELSRPEVKVMEKGFPGELTPNELDIVKQLKSELAKRDPAYYEIIRSFDSVEKEAYALCRFLRSRKFNVEKVFEMLDMAMEGWKEAKANDFYPDLEQSMGVSKSVFLSQYPAVMAGNARNGCPVMYLRAGSIQPEGLKCIVSFDNVDRFFWNDVMYELVSKLQAGRELNPQFVRCENISVYDLKGITRAQVSSDTFDMIKVGNKVMLAFPETLHCLLIINAPSWFGLVWSLIKKLIDPRTASKIEVFTSTKPAYARMKELIDPSQIPLDYGGSGPALAQSASGVRIPGVRPKVVTISHLMMLSKKCPENEYEFELDTGKQLSLSLYTRCPTGVKAGLIRGNTLITEIDVIGEREDEPYHRTIGACVGPGKFMVKLKSNSLPGNYLLIGQAHS